MLNFRLTHTLWVTIRKSMGATTLFFTLTLFKIFLDGLHAVGPYSEYLIEDVMWFNHRFFSPKGQEFKWWFKITLCKSHIQCLPHSRCSVKGKHWFSFCWNSQMLLFYYLNWIIKVKYCRYSNDPNMLRKNMSVDSDIKLQDLDPGSTTYVKGDLQSYSDANALTSILSIPGNNWMLQFSSVQSISHVRLFATPWIAARQASLSITNSQSPPKLMSIELVMPSSHLIFCRPLLLLPPIPPSIRVPSNESTLCMRWPKYWSFSFSISPSNEHPGLISFRMDSLDLLAV